MLNIVKLFIANWGLENVWKKNCYFCLCSLFLSSSLPFPIRVRHILAAINWKLVQLLLQTNWWFIGVWKVIFISLLVKMQKVVFKWVTNLSKRYLYWLLVLPKILSLANLLLILLIYPFIHHLNGKAIFEILNVNKKLKYL